MDNTKTIYSDNVIELAKKNAGEMILNKETLRRIQFGHASGFFYLSDNSEALISDKEINLDGRNFYIGIYKK